MEGTFDGPLSKPRRGTQQEMRRQALSQDNTGKQNRLPVGGVTAPEMPLCLQKTLCPTPPPSWFSFMFYFLLLILHGVFEAGYRCGARAVLTSLIFLPWAPKFGAYGICCHAWAPPSFPACLLLACFLPPAPTDHRI